MTDGQLAGLAAHAATDGRVDNDEAAQPVDQEATNRPVAQGAVAATSLPSQADHKGQVKGTKLSFLMW